MPKRLIARWPHATSPSWCTAQPIPYLAENSPRVHCARAFAAEAPLLIADEPTAALDLRHQFQVMELLRRFVDAGGGVLVVLHDVGLAVRFADRLIWMKDGAILANGSPEETLTVDRIRTVYGMHARVERQGAEWSVQIEGVA